MNIWLTILDWWRGTSFGAARSPQWTQVRRNFIKLHPACAVCGTKGGLLKPNELHHCQPFHIKPDLELSPENLITLCRDHHFEWGHYFSWKSWNENVREDAKQWLERVKNRPVDNRIATENS